MHACVRIDSGDGWSRASVRHLPARAVADAAAPALVHHLLHHARRAR